MQRPRSRGTVRCCRSSPSSFQMVLLRAPPPQTTRTPLRPNRPDLAGLRDRPRVGRRRKCIHLNMALTSELHPDRWTASGVCDLESLGKQASILLPLGHQAGARQAEGDAAARRRTPGDPVWPYLCWSSNRPSRAALAVAGVHAGRVRLAAAGFAYAYVECGDHGRVKRAACRPTAAWSLSRHPAHQAPEQYRRSAAGLRGSRFSAVRSLQLYSRTRPERLDAKFNG